MFVEEFAEVAAEMNEILDDMPDNYIEKIPIKTRKFLKKTANKNYVSNLNPYRSLEEQNLRPKTLVLLTIFYKDYWCTPKQKEMIDNSLTDEEKRYERELRDILYKKQNRPFILRKIELFRHQEKYVEENIGFFKGNII